MSVPMKQRNASSVLPTIGPPRTLKLVSMISGHPVCASNSEKQRVVARVGLLCRCGLPSRRVATWVSRRDRGTWHVQVVDAEQVLLVHRHRDALLLGDQQHVRRLQARPKYSGAFGASLAAPRARTAGMTRGTSLENRLPDRWPALAYRPVRLCPAPQSPLTGLTKISIHPSTFGCLRSRSRQTSTKFHFTADELQQRLHPSLRRPSLEVPFHRRPSGPDHYALSSRGGASSGRRCAGGRKKTAGLLTAPRELSGSEPNLRGSAWCLRRAGSR